MTPGRRSLMVALLLAACVLLALLAARAGPARAGFLIAPYLDLDEPGARGSYYALSEAPGCA